MNTSGLNHIEDDTHSAIWIPTELLVVIIENIESDDDLLTLAGASRRFHDLALSQHFSRHGFDPFSKEVNINFSLDGSINFLKGLAVSLNFVGTSIDRLSYDFGYTQDSSRVMKEVQLLTQYIAKLSSVTSVNLRLATHLRGPPEKWRNMNIVLLNTILSRSCRDIHITTSLLSTLHEEPKNMPPSSKPTDWLKGYWPANQFPPRGTPKILKTCFIQTFPRFLRPFYFFTLSTNAGSITDLSFTNIFGGGADWTTMLASITFPNLHRLVISYCVIARDPLSKFLQRHPGTLTAFEYHHIRYDPRPKAPLRVRLLDHVFQSTLQTLTMSPEHIVHFMPPFSVLRRLNSIEIVVEEAMGQNGGGNFAPLEAALRVLAASVNRITLTLMITRTGLGFGAWFAQAFAPSRGGFRPKVRPESELHCVENLVMDNGEWGFTDGALYNYMPRWLLLFPNLQELTLRGKRKFYKYIVGEEDDTVTFVDGLKEACPHIHIECSPGNSTL